MKQEIKTEIEMILQDYWDYTIEETRDHIVALFPKWRVPENDGFPKDNIDCLFLLHTGFIIDNTILFFDSLMDRKNIVKWIYRSEFDKIMEVNK